MTASPRFVLLVTPRPTDIYEERLDTLVAEIGTRTAALQLVDHQIGWRLLIDPTRLRYQASRDSALSLLGDVFDHAGRPLDPCQLEDLTAKYPSVADRGRWLINRTWGRYVALLRRSYQAADICCVRDPTGAIPAYRLRQEQLAMVSDETPRWLIDLLGHKVSPNWSAIGAALAHPTVATYRSMLDGLDVIPSGTLFPLFYGTPTPLWRPADFATPATAIGATDAADLLRDRVTTCCAAWGRRYSRPLLELSGGLDSSIVLGSLVDAGAFAINFATGFTAGDERGYARAAADRAGIKMLERLAIPEAIDYRVLVTDLPAATPRLYGLDPQHDDTVAAEAMAQCANAIFTGQGGDGLFLQMPSIAIAIDRARMGWDSQALGLSFTLARRARCSVWRVWRDIVRDRWNRRATPPMRFISPLMSKKLIAMLSADRAIHPWLDGIGGLPPGKRQHIEILANGQLFMLPTRRGRAVPLIHPLLSQPILEACLAIPTFILAPDDRDRGLARDAFADRVPQSTLRRNSKGEASSYFSRGLAANLPLVREWLLDGALVREGLLDRDALETTLDADRLLWADEAGLPTLYLNIESWLRQWLS